ncbi:MAG: hypothetical protein D4S01_06215 [Dehalococcoidia bacterium]|nr:MAG: hypothetical protein D4S01_06215 [Dehalococcoidia bacterium]
MLFLIALIAALVGGLIAGLKIPLFLLPMLSISKIKNKNDIFLILFVIYALTIGYEFEVASIYGLDPIKTFSILIPSLLLLDAGLRSREEEFNRMQFAAFVVFFIIGWFLRPIFVIAAFGAFILYFSNSTRRGAFITIFSIFLLIVGVIIGESTLNMEGGTATQVVFISALSTLIALVFFWKRVERIEFVPLEWLRYKL